MSFQVEYIRSDGKIEHVDYNDEDAFNFLPGGVLGVWSDSSRSAGFYPAGTWQRVHSTLQRPGEHTDDKHKIGPVPFLYPAAPPRD